MNKRERDKREKFIRSLMDIYTREYAEFLADKFNRPVRNKEKAPSKRPVRKKKAPSKQSEETDDE